MAKSVEIQYASDLEKYDQSTLMGRVRKLREIFDPSMLFVSDRKIKKSEELLTNFEKGLFKNDNPETNRKLWEARNVVDATLHPQTKEKIPLPFRFSAFAPVNLPIIFGMLQARTPGVTIFWQWFNQSYNVAVNYCNGNKTTSLNTSQIAASYGLAVTVSCGLSLGLGRLVAPAARYSNTLGMLARALVPFLSVSSAGVANVLLMRRSEAEKGIEVYDETGRVIGVSKQAAKKALREVAMTRAVLPLPTLLIPALVMGFLEKKKAFSKAPRLVLPFNLLMITILIHFTLPFSIGLFSQRGSIERNKLENIFKNTTDNNILYYNKGL